MRANDTQVGVVLEALQAAGDKGVTNIDLNKICFRYGARIWELRQAGHTITSVSEGKKIWRFTLLAPQPKEQLSLFPKEANANQVFNAQKL